MSTPSPEKSKSPLKGWRTVLDIHPAADLFPLMVETDPAALKELCEDIKKNGLRVPITVIKRDGQYILLDGRNRLDAMELAGINLVENGELKAITGAFGRSNVSFAPSNLTDAEIASLVISANILRRHLTPEQKRDLISKLVALHPEKSDRALAADLKVDKNAVSRVRKKVAATGAIAPVEKRTGKDGKVRRMPTKTGETAMGAPMTAGVLHGLAETAEKLKSHYTGAADNKPHRVRLKSKEIRDREVAVMVGAVNKHTTAEANEIQRLKKVIIGLEGEIADLKKENADLRAKLEAQSGTYH